MYDALVAGNVPEDKAREAAEELADFRHDMAKIRTDRTLLKWMMGAILIVELGQFVRALFG
jgi:hypothetical protein